jgi:hypothetical protein
VLAYWLLARRQSRPAAWFSSNQQRECSAFTVRRAMPERGRVNTADALTAILAVALTALEKWV